MRGDAGETQAAWIFFLVHKETDSQRGQFFGVTIAMFNWFFIGWRWIRASAPHTRKEKLKVPCIVSLCGGMSLLQSEQQCTVANESYI